MVLISSSNLQFQSKYQSILSLREMASQVDIPKKYKACIYDEPGKISTKVVELDMPEVRIFW